MPSDTENGDAMVTSSGREEPLTESDADGSSKIEPYVGMEFETEEAARHFYEAYAISIGFTVRIHDSKRAGDGTVHRIKLVCNKEGFRRTTSTSSQIRKRRGKADTRQGCKAEIVFARGKTGKWLVARFVKDHNHPLEIASGILRRAILLSRAPDEKEAAIQELTTQLQELTAELQRERERSAAYLQQLEILLKDMEEQSGYLSRNIQDIFQSVRGIESNKGRGGNNLE